MIQGNFYKGSDLQVTLKTQVDVSAATSATIIAEFTGGPVKQYTGSAVSFDSVQATIPADDNIYPGKITVRAVVILPVIGKKYGDPDDLFILDTPTPT